MKVKKYITYEEPLKGESFTLEQMQEVYEVRVDKKNIRNSLYGFMI